MPRVRRSFVVAVVLIGGAMVLGRRWGDKVGGDEAVRCQDGHLFIKTRIPSASSKAIRFGPVRFQHCPVGRHWTLVRLVKDLDLTDKERLIDVRVP